jgi:hypothetical protein
MKAQELRIGNYVVPPVGCEPHIGEITAINLESYDCELIDDNYEEYVSISQFGKIRDLDPIPLTEEWLLKFWFISNPYEDRYEKGSIHIECLKTKGETYLWIENMPHIKYVHQLQNLYFALTGEDLTIGGSK